MSELYMNEYTLAEVRAMIDRELSDPSTDWTGRSSNKPADGEFHDGWELSDAAQALITGWDEHHEEMREETDRLLDKLQETVNDYIGSHHKEVRDVSGGFVDMDRFLMGDPECMVESWLDEDTKQGKAIKVLVNCVASWDVSASKLIKRGAAIIAAVEAVIASGMNVELWVGESVNRGWRGGDGEHAVEMVCVKEYNDLIDPDVLAYTVAHPTMLRRICFYLNEQRPPEQIKNFGFTSSGGYGSVCDMPTEVHEQFDLVIERYKRGQESDAESIFKQMITHGERASEYA